MATGGDVVQGGAMSALRPGDITDEMIQAMDTAKFRRGTHHRIDHGFELRPRRQCYVGDGLGYGGRSRACSSQARTARRS